jgi:hypothetical protein
LSLFATLATAFQKHLAHLARTISFPLFSFFLFGPSQESIHPSVPGAMLKSTLSALWLATLAWGAGKTEEDNVKSIGVRCYVLWST